MSSEEDQSEVTPGVFDRLKEMAAEGPPVEYDHPRTVWSATHMKDRVVLTFKNGNTLVVPADRVWHIFSVLRNHMKIHGAYDDWGRRVPQAEWLDW